MNKLVYSVQANNEHLPFPSECCGAYLSSLSLMLVGDHLQMLKEAYRVL